MSLETLLLDVLRFAVTIVALVGILAFWYVLCSSLTPFPANFTPSQAEAEKRRSARYATLHKHSVRIDVIFFVWLVVEGAFLIPWMFMRYGLQ